MQVHLHLNTSTEVFAFAFENFENKVFAFAFYRFPNWPKYYYLHSEWQMQPLKHLYILNVSQM